MKWMGVKQPSIDKPAQKGKFLNDAWGKATRQLLLIDE